MAGQQRRPQRECRRGHKGEVEGQQQAFQGDHKAAAHRQGDREDQQRAEQKLEGGHLEDASFRELLSDKAARGIEQGRDQHQSLAQKGDPAVKAGGIDDDDARKAAQHADDFQCGEPFILEEQRREEYREESGGGGQDRGLGRGGIGDADVVEDIHQPRLHRAVERSGSDQATGEGRGLFSDDPRRDKDHDARHKESRAREGELVRYALDIQFIIAVFDHRVRRSPQRGTEDRADSGKPRFVEQLFHKSSLYSGADSVRHQLSIVHYQVSIEKAEA